MKMSIENLEQGMSWWNAGKWPKDYQNEEYYSVYQDRSAGLTERWIELTVDRLASWKALRTSKPGNTKAKFQGLLKARLSNFQTEYQRILSRSDNEPSIETVSWRDIGSLYEMMANIKNQSPVFGSKPGHFIFPKVFIVMDNFGTSVMPYEFYWPGMVEQWLAFADKSEAIDRLRTHIEKQSRKQIHPDYPYETKIMELCHIGHKRRN